MTDSSELSSTGAECVFTHLIKANDPMGLFASSDCDALGKEVGDTLVPLTFPPLETLPCANVCPDPGKLPCARCKLVSYCSQKCERKHRSIHKRDCGASPDFTTFPDVGSQDDSRYSSRSPSLGREEITPIMAASLSGNLPAVDIVNLKNNERDGTRDFSLAFVDSGDLRNVIRTVNALGSDFTGHLHILLNDTSDTVTSRNIVLLLILGAMPNEAVAADIALHFWYSVFLPDAYRLRILASLVLVLQQHADKTEPLSVALGRCAKLTCLVPREITDRLLYTVGPTRSTLQARDEYERVGATPDRRDVRKRALAGVKPCHGLAFMAIWRSGVVLPFSASNDHHTVPNASMFSPCGTWLQNNDSVENPLASWDPNDVIKSGQAHGAQPEDIFGCLYFFLSDQLRTFARRVRDLDVTFHMFNTTAQTLARDISGGQYARFGLTQSVRFDRIDLGHVLADSGCVQNVLTSWAPLLAGGDAAAIVGVFSDWTRVQKEGSVAGAEDAVVAPIVGKLIKLGRLPLGTTLESAMTTEIALLDAAYDNSKAFSRFLKAIALSEVLRETNLKRRLRHKILPHRHRMPIDAKTSDLPHMPDDETWYRYAKLARISFVARYVELARTTA